MGIADGARGIVRLGAGALLIGLALVTTALYARTVTAAPVYDDARWLTWAQWQAWSAGPTGGPWAWCLWLAQAPWMLAIGAGGGWVWPAHLVAIGIHLVNGALLAQIARRWLTEATTVLVVGVFWLHPLQVEAVAYLSGARDALVVTGVLVAALAWRCAPGWRWGVGALALLVASAVKPSARPVLVVTPLVLLGLVSDARLWRWASLAGLAALVMTAAPGALLRTSGQLCDLARHVLWPFGLAAVHDAPTGVWSVVAAVGFALAGGVAWRSRVWWAWVWVVGVTAPRALVADAPPLAEHHLYGPSLAVWLCAGVGLDVVATRHALLKGLT